MNLPNQEPPPVPASHTSLPFLPAGPVPAKPRCHAYRHPHYPHSPVYPLPGCSLPPVPYACSPPAVPLRNSLTQHVSRSFLCEDVLLSYLPQKQPAPYHPFPQKVLAERYPAPASPQVFVWSLPSPPLPLTHRDGLQYS